MSPLQRERISLAVLLLILASFGVTMFGCTAPKPLYQPGEDDGWRSAQR